MPQVVLFSSLSLTQVLFPRRRKRKAASTYLFHGAHFSHDWELEVLPQLWWKWWRRWRHCSSHRTLSVCAYFTSFRFTSSFPQKGASKRTKRRGGVLPWPRGTPPPTHWVSPSKVAVKSSVVTDGGLRKCQVTNYSVGPVKGSAYGLKNEGSGQDYLERCHTLIILGSLKVFTVDGSVWGG